ncbi:MAG TPA: hypothetical protein VNL77_16920 [Roseiflexaceae bacterium]|nr:hypothetical protein [Roseiflexaceae bacterium]
MLSTPDLAPARQDEVAHDASTPVEWAPLAVPPLTVLLLAIAAVARTPLDLAVAALSLLALALAAAAFAAARGADGG